MYADYGEPDHSESADPDVNTTEEDEKSDASLSLLLIDYGHEPDHTESADLDCE